MRARLALLAACAGCSALPRITLVHTPAERAAITQACRRTFPQIPWSATHAIDARLPLGQDALLVGATRMDAETLRAVLMSPEGIVLFDATSRGDVITVHRALPPLDGPSFAEGLVGDVRQTFAAPVGPPTAVGRTEGGTAVCRYQAGDGKTTDVEVDGGAPKRIRAFDGSSVVREIQLVGSADDGFYPEVVLRTPGMGGYTLKMRLISHEPAP
jgi:hypothetical protein